jgi:hypothetical protein
MVLFLFRPFRGLANELADALRLLRIGGYANRTFRDIVAAIVAANLTGKLQFARVREGQDKRNHGTLPSLSVAYTGSGSGRELRHGKPSGPAFGGRVSGGLGSRHVSLQTRKPGW